MSTRAVILLAIALLGEDAIACSYPEAPRTIPDGRKADRQAMLETMKEIDRYRRAVAQFVSCEGGSPRARNVQAEMDRIAGRFNAEVRAFKVANED